MEESGCRPDKEKFFERFAVPDVAAPCIDAIVTPLEQRVIAGLDLGADGVFTFADVARSLSCPLTDADLSHMSLEGLPAVSDAEVSGFITKAYRRGIFSRAGNAEGPDEYRLSDFYGRLDIFAIAEQDAWRALPIGSREAVESWYFDAYYAGLDWDKAGGKPTDETILTLDEALDAIDENERLGRRHYLTDCDCRSLLGECEKPTLVCLSYHDGVNSYPDRGLSRLISYREAKAILTAADRAGLVHTANPWGMCNCCNDCCYLFRARERRGSGAAWPQSVHLVSMDAEKCLGCGICLGRCMFGVFDDSDLPGDGRASAVTSRCVGCGVCISTCPAGALTLGGRG
ncbi:MAG: 4Fe-4S binding protein [Clostridiales Family XIII bacterium]|jgi:ferredoxin|nr:4Fe-4S binding protein [Clostridiales Family XIII bacterium]